MPPAAPRSSAMGTSTLHDSCGTGDYNAVRHLVENSKKQQAKQTKKVPGPSRTWEKLEGCVNDKDSTGRTPLHYAIEGGHEDIVKYLVKQGADVAVARADRSTPLHIACAGNSPTIVKMLMSKGDKGAALKALNEQGSTPLHLAAAGGHDDIVAMLLQHGAPINSRRSFGNTPLHYAVINGHQSVVDLLIANRADINSLNNRGSSLLHFAASRGHANLVEKFLEQGIESNIPQNDGNTALHFSATHGHSDVCNILLDAGANPDSQNTLGNSPLHCSSSSGNDEITEILVVKGQADIALQQNNGCTPLHFASKEGNGDTVAYLVAMGAPLDATDEQGQSALHYSCLGGHAEVTMYLIDEGADVEGKSESGNTPLHCAATRGHPTIVRKLVDRGADVNAMDEDGATPLHGACARGDPSVVSFLVDAGADYDAQDKDGDTPLHGAASMGHPEVVNVLIHAGADLSKANSLGLTPIHQAENAGHRNVALAITNSRDPRTGKTPLFKLVEELSMDPPPERVREIEDTVHDYIQCSADVNVEVDRMTPLLLAIHHGYEDIAADFIKHGADVNNGHPLLAAALEICGAGTDAAALDHKSVGKMQRSRWDFLHRTSELLVAYGADVNAKIEGHSPLELAMQAGCADFAQMLLESNAQFSPQIFFDSLEELQTPIPDARRKFIEEMSNAFISSGSMDLSQPMPDGNTPLQLAIKGGQPEVVLKLINAGCDININNPLVEVLSALEEQGPKSAAGPKFIEATLAIISRGPQFEDKGTVSPMDLAIKLGVTEIADSILAAGVDVNQHPYFTNCMAELATISIPQNEIEEERYTFLETLALNLMDSGASVNVPDEKKNSPLELAIDANSWELVNHLLKPTDSSAARMQRVNVDKKNAQGDTVLIQCLKAMTEDDAIEEERYGFLESTALRLVDYGADHQNALQFAASASHLAMVEILMSRHVELDTFTDDPVKRKFPGRDELDSYFPEGHPDPVIKTCEEMDAIPDGEPWTIKGPDSQAGDGVVFGENNVTMYMMGTKKSEVPLLYSMLLELEELKLNGKSGERVDFLVDVASRFVKADAKVKVFHEHRALLDVAINTDELPLVQIIMDKLDDIDLLDTDTGSTVLYRLLTQRKLRIESGDSALKALVARREDFVHDVASVLLSRGAELHVSGEHGSLFDCAIGCGAWEVCGLILEQSSMYGFCDAGSVPFLHKVLEALASDFVVASGDEAKAVVETMAINLVDRGCDVNQEFDGKQPFDVAVVTGAQRVINYLLRKGALFSLTIVHTLLTELIEAEDEQRKVFLENITLNFIDTSADVDVEVDGVSPLALAIKAKNKVLTQRIVQKSHQLGFPSVPGRQLLDSVVKELAEAKGHASDEKMMYFNFVLPSLATRGWFVLQEVMAACGDNNFQANEVVMHCLDDGADPASPNPDFMNETPLHAAAAMGLKTIAIKLLEMGARVDALNDVAETPLIKACLHGKVNMVELLLANGANINATASGAFCNMGPLHIAAACENPGMVEVLLRNPTINVNLAGHFGRSALHEAFYTSKAHPEVSEELVYALLDAAADVNAQDVDGRTPLMLAAKIGMLSVVRQMIERDADVEITDNSGDTVYDHAVIGCQHSVFNFVNRRNPLPESGQKRVLMHAIKSGMLEIVDELLEVGGSVNVLDTRAGPHPVVINVTWDEPLWWAAYFGNSELVAKLLKIGVNAGVADGKRRTLFHWCTLWGLPQHHQVLEVLCAANSPAANAPDADGQSPLDLAVAMGNAKNAALLGGDACNVSAPKPACSWDEAVAISNDNDKPFCDPEFDVSLRSLCESTETAADLVPKFSNIEWKRPNEIIEGSVARLDLAQLSQVELGPCGNAWLLSSVLVAQDLPYGLTTIFDQREISKEGVYSFKFRFGGIETSIVVDDRIPCLEGMPLYGGFGAGNNIAFMLLEKALAKLVGSYQGLADGTASELFRVSPMGKALFEVCKPPDFVEDEELTELVHEVCKSACIMMLESSCAMYGDHSSPESLAQITEFFTQGVDPAKVGVHKGAKHIWAAAPKRVLPGTGSCSCQEPVVTIQVNVKSKVRVEVDSAESAANIRIYQTAAEGESWTFVWRHSVPGSSTEFDLLLEPSMYPYILFFTQMGNNESSKPCYFDLWSDKELVMGMVENNEDLMMEIAKL